MLARVSIERRLFGFDTGDWTMLVAGIVLIGLLAVLA